MKTEKEIKERVSKLLNDRVEANNDFENANFVVDKGFISEYIEDINYEIKILNWVLS